MTAEFCPFKYLHALGGTVNHVDLIARLTQDLEVRRGCPAAATAASEVRPLAPAQETAARWSRTTRGNFPSSPVEIGSSEGRPCSIGFYREGECHAGD